MNYIDIEKYFENEFHMVTYQPISDFTSWTYRLILSMIFWEVNNFIWKEIYVFYFENIFLVRLSKLCSECVFFRYLFNYVFG